MMTDIKLYEFISNDKDVEVLTSFNNDLHTTLISPRK